MWEVGREQFLELQIRYGGWKMILDFAGRLSQGNRQ